MFKLQIIIKILSSASIEFFFSQMSWWSVWWLVFCCSLFVSQLFCLVDDFTQRTMRLLLLFSVPRLLEYHNISSFVNIRLTLLIGARHSLILMTLLWYAQKEFVFSNGLECIVWNENKCQQVFVTYQRTECSYRSIWDDNFLQPLICSYSL